MKIDFTQRELECLKKMLMKTIRASKKNLTQTKDEEQKEIIKKTLREKEVMLSKIKEFCDH